MDRDDLIMCSTYIIELKLDKLAHLLDKFTAVNPPGYLSIAEIQSMHKHLKLEKKPVTQFRFKSFGFTAQSSVKRPTHYLVAARYCTISRARIKYMHKIVRDGTGDLLNTTVYVHAAPIQQL